jgi:proline utilization trans-activator
MLDHVRGMKKQAPTYSILSHIAMQFADITGIYDQPGNAEGTLSQTSDPSPEPRAASVHDSVMSSLVENSDFQEDWFASATANLGLDFFDLNHIPGALPLQPSDTAYPGYIEPMVNQVDDWTTRTLRGVHSL